MKKKESPSFARVWLLIPRVFLERFDKAIEDVFPSRSEAIRRGMTLVLEEVKGFRREVKL